MSYSLSLSADKAIKSYAYRFLVSIYAVLNSTLHSVVANFSNEISHYYFADF